MNPSASVLKVAGCVEGLRCVAESLASFAHAAVHQGPPEPEQRLQTQRQALVELARLETRLARGPNADGPAIKSFGRYRDVLVRCPDGRWRIKERRNEREAGRPAAVANESGFN